MKRGLFLLGVFVTSLVISIIIFSNFVSADFCAPGEYPCTCKCGENDGDACFDDFDCPGGVCNNEYWTECVEPFCGDGICNNGEDCFTCIGDCDCPPCFSKCADACGIDWSGSCESSPVGVPYASRDCGDITQPFYFPEYIGCYTPTLGYCICREKCIEDYECPDTSVCSGSTMTINDWSCTPGHYCNLDSSISYTCGNTCDTSLHWTGSCTASCSSSTECGTCTPSCTCISPYVNANGLSFDGCECLPTTEVCDGLDNDCDGGVDENWPSLGNSCTVGVGECRRTGTIVCKSDGSGTECSVSPGSPVSENTNTRCSDGLDNDCDGLVDCSDSNCPDDYPTDVCYICTDSCSSLGYECGTHVICGVSTNCGTCLSGQVCNPSFECVTPNMYWASYSTEFPISSYSTDNLPYSIYMVIENSGLTQGTVVNFWVYEDDSSLDDSIRTETSALSATIDSNGRASRSISITETDIENSIHLWEADYENDDVYEFYFKVNDLNLYRSGNFNLGYSSAYCGDGYLDSGEQCDDGSSNGNVCSPSYDSSCTYCSSSCTTITLYGEYCGDGTCNGPETCGTTNTAPECNSDCGTCPADCGDGDIDSGEECDDGNTQSGDGCSASCVDEYCGDDVINNVDEQCDNNGQNGVACSPPYDDSCQYCSSSCIIVTLQGGYCGDDIVNGDEDCDDGNTQSGDGCSASCVDETCDDGIQNQGEEGVDCGGPCAPCTNPAPNWVSADAYETIITSSQENPRIFIEGITFRMIVTNSELSQGDTADFYIRERDSVTDDNIRTISGTVDSNGKASADWTIQEADLEAASGALDNEDSIYATFEFYFRLNGDSDIESGELVVLNEGGEEPTECTDDMCIGAQDCMDLTEICCTSENPCGITHTLPECDTYECTCMWDSDSGECNTIWSASGDLSQGYCIVDYVLTQTCDDANVASGTIQTTWISGTSNEGQTECNALNGNVFSYDCPAEIALPFFGTWGIIATIAIIIGIYVALSLRTENKKKK